MSCFFSHNWSQPSTYGLKDDSAYGEHEIVQICRKCSKMRSARFAKGKSHWRYSSSTMHSFTGVSCSCYLGESHR